MFQIRLLKSLEKGVVKKKIIVEIDLTDLDADITARDIKEIHIVYGNVGEGHDCEDAVPFRILHGTSIKWKK